MKIEERERHFKLICLKKKNMQLQVKKKKRLTKK